MRSCGLPVILEIFHQTGEAIDAEPNLDPILLDVDAFDQQLDNAILFGWEELVPDRVELFERVAHLGFGDVVDFAARRAPCADHDFGGAQDGAQLVDHDALDIAGRDAGSGVLSIR